MEISMGPKEKEFFRMKEKYILTQPTWFLVANYVPLSGTFSKKILKFIWKILPPNSDFGTLDSRWLAAGIFQTEFFKLNSKHYSCTPVQFTFYNVRLFTGRCLRSRPFRPCSCQKMPAEDTEKRKEGRGGVCERGEQANSHRSPWRCS